MSEALLSYYSIFKSLHIIFVVSWFAGLFYVVRLFIYHREAELKSTTEKEILQLQFSLMQWRLWYIITTPAMVLTVVFGTLMLLANPYLLQLPWMQIKLTLVGVLLVYHALCQQIMNQQRTKQNNWSATGLRIWNEVATLLLVAIVFLVEMQDTLSWVGGIVGFFSVGIGLMIGIRLYKKLRSKSEK